MCPPASAHEWRSAMNLGKGEGCFAQQLDRIDASVQQLHAKYATSLPEAVVDSLVIMHDTNAPTVEQKSRKR